MGEKENDQMELWYTMYEQMKGSCMYADARVSIRLPGEYLDFVREYANQRRTTVSELLVGFIKGLKNSCETKDDKISPEVQRMIGIVPIENLKDDICDYYAYLEKKHT